MHVRRGWTAGSRITERSGGDGLGSWSPGSGCGCWPAGRSVWEALESGDQVKARRGEAHRWQIRTSRRPADGLRRPRSGQALGS